MVLQSILLFKSEPLGKLEDHMIRQHSRGNLFPFLGILIVFQTAMESIVVFPELYDY